MISIWFLQLMSDSKLRSIVRAKMKLLEKEMAIYKNCQDQRRIDKKEKYQICDSETARGPAGWAIYKDMRRKAKTRAKPLIP